MEHARGTKLARAVLLVVSAHGLAWPQRQPLAILAHGIHVWMRIHASVSIAAVPSLFEMRAHLVAFALTTLQRLGGRVDRRDRRPLRKARHALGPAFSKVLVQCRLLTTRMNTHTNTHTHTHMRTHVHSQ